MYVNNLSQVVTEQTWNGRTSNLRPLEVARLSFAPHRPHVAIGTLQKGGDKLCEWTSVYLNSASKLKM